jgi:hypothetical protein
MVSAAVLRSESAGRGWPSYTPEHCALAFCDSQDCSGGILTLPHTGNEFESVKDDMNMELMDSDKLVCTRESDLK